MAQAPTPDVDGIKGLYGSASDQQEIIEVKALGITKLYSRVDRVVSLSMCRSRSCASAPSPAKCRNGKYPSPLVRR